MWGWATGGALLLLLLPPGAVGLQCLSCGAEDGSCHESTNVTCPPESDVCAEALASVTWSHGRLSLGGRGCGRGQAGSLARALELPGVVVFVRRRQCRGRGGACNGALPLGTERALPREENVTAQAPNGLRCFGCPDNGPCSPPTVVECYGELRACFHGNVTVTLGGSRRWREVRGCVRDPSCAPQPLGDDAVGLEGSCCSGDLCNGPNGTHGLFAPDLPRLQLLPQPHGPTAPAPDADGSGGGGKMAASAGRTATAAVNMAASVGNGSADATNMAASVGNVSADATNMAPTAANMAASQTAMAASRGGAAPTVANGAAAESNMAAATLSNMAAPMATAGNTAAADHHRAAMGSKMAAGSGGQPLERKDGVKGPVGRSQALGGAGLWPLPFLLLLLLL